MVTRTRWVRGAACRTALPIRPAAVSSGVSAGSPVTPQSSSTAPVRERISGTHAGVGREVQRTRRGPGAGAVGVPDTTPIVTGSVDFLARHLKP